MNFSEFKTSLGTKSNCYKIYSCSVVVPPSRSFIITLNESTVSGPENACKNSAVIFKSVFYLSNIS